MAMQIYMITYSQ